MAASPIVRLAGLLILVALGCGDPAAPPAPAPAPAAVRAVATAAARLELPKLPASPDGGAELRALDQRIHDHAGEPALEILLLLERAELRGRLDDYTEALRRSRAWVAAEPGRRAWQTRAQVLLRVRKLGEARAAVEQLRRWVRDPDELEGLVVTLDDAAGVSRAAYREAMARDYPDPTTLMQWAATLSAADRPAEALAVMERVPAALHDNPPALLSAILVRWGELRERTGELAAARACYEAAHARLATLDATLHLARVLAATGGDPSALLAAAIAIDPHPALLALAGRRAEAARGWERYVAALPEAFAAPAARFYLDAGAADPAAIARGYALAQLDHANRDTAEARALVVEAALAAGDSAAACAIAPTLAGGTRADQQLARRAFTACHRDADAAALPIR